MLSAFDHIMTKTNLNYGCVTIFNKNCQISGQFAMQFQHAVMALTDGFRDHRAKRPNCNVAFPSIFY